MSVVEQYFINEISLSDTLRILVALFYTLYRISKSHKNNRKYSYITIISHKSFS